LEWMRPVMPRTVALAFCSHVFPCFSGKENEAKCGEYCHDPMVIG
jgi:hypothetical protein